MNLSVLNDGQRPHPRLVIRILVADIRQKAPVDLVDDEINARQKAFYHINRPFFQCFRHDRMVRVRHRPHRQLPRLRPGDIFLVNEEPHHLRHGERRMRIVDMNGDFIGNMVNIDVRFFYIAQNALHAGGDKEILLNEPQTPSFVRAVVGVEKLRDAFHHLLVALPVLPLPLRGEPVSGKIAINLRVPEAERIHRVIFCADHRHIVGHSQHCRIAFVHQLQRPVVLLPHISVAAKAYINRLIRLSILPCESVAQPTVRQLNLIAIDNFLFEKPIFIANTAPVRGKRQRCHRVNEAGGKPPETAVAQTGIRLLVVKLRQREV